MAERHSDSGRGDVWEWDPSKSPWASDVVLVRRKDGQMRFAVDYRKLNDLTKKDAFTLPNSQSILDQSDGSMIFSCMDVAAAYWCVPVREEHKEKTAFDHQEGSLKYFLLDFAILRRHSKD